MSSDEKRGDAGDGGARYGAAEQDDAEHDGAIIDPGGETIDTMAQTQMLSSAEDDDETVDHDASEVAATPVTGESLTGESLTATMARTGAADQGFDTAGIDDESMDTESMDTESIDDEGIELDDDGLNEEAAPCGPLPSGGFALRLANFHVVKNPDGMAFAIAMSVAAAMILPFLGRMGFFDPWESHYAEVARQMAVRDDYLYPFWKNGYFFSKPVLLFWLTGPMYKLIGTADAVGELPAATELFGRLPMALIGLFTIATVWFSCRRLFGRRAATLAALVLATTPFFLFISRQAITDMLYVGPMSSAICLLAVAFFDDDTREHWKKSRLPWLLLAFFALCLFPQLWEIGRSGAFLDQVTLLGSEFATRLAFSALLCLLAAVGLFALRRRCRDPLIHLAAALVAIATLGKGPHALLFTGLPYFLYFVVSGEWRLLKRPAMLTGIVLYLAICMPWYTVMALFDGKDGGKLWYQRFILYDLFGRLGGVHGERATHDYYVRYFAFGTLPWTPLAVIATISALMQRLRSQALRTAADRMTLLTAIWALSLFTFFAFTQTKFHHYIFPVVVPSAILIGRFLDRLLDSRHRLPVGLGILSCMVVAVVGRDLVAEPWQLADLFSYHYVGYKASYYFPDDLWWRISIGVMTALSVFMLVIGLFSDWAFGRVAQRLTGALSGPASRAAAPAGPTSSASIWLRLIAWPSTIGRGIFSGQGRTVNGGFVLCALLGAFFFATFTTHVYQPHASQHWSHRQLLHTYWSMKQPGDRLVSYQMDWKGETFYSHNTEEQIKKSATKLKKVVEAPGRTFVLVQQDRFKRIASAVGKAYKDQIKVIDRSNKKWFLVLVDDPPAAVKSGKAAQASDGAKKGKAKQKKAVLSPITKPVLLPSGPVQQGAVSDRRADSAKKPDSKAP